MRKSAEETIENIDNSTSDLISEIALQAVPVASLCAADMIALLKERLVRLHRHVENRRQLFRLSYSILTLETCLEEKRISHIAIERSPGIHTILKRLEAEIDTLCQQEGVTHWGEKEAVVDAIDHGSDPTIGRLLDGMAQLSHQLEQMCGQTVPLREESEVLRLLADLQKNIVADGRRNYASQAALHASIERLSDRLEQIERRVSQPMDAGPQNALHAIMATEAVRERNPIDPRPMLMAARAAAARALMDLEPKSSDAVHNTPPPDDPPRPHRPKPSEPRRRWGFSFAAA